jgi:ABC-type multidrug transport system fused ATPase/permease subunit
MVDLRDLPQCIVNSFSSSSLRISHSSCTIRSYVTWAVAILTIVLYQFNGLVEKYWLKQWGEAYNTSDSSNNVQALSYLSSSQEPISDFTRNAFGSHSYAMSLNFQTPNLWMSSLPEAGAHPLFFIGVYCAIVTTTSILKTISTGAYYMSFTYGGRKLFDDMLNKIVRATMRWYDTTPSGRILNRFSKDIETIDTSVAQFLWLINAEALGLVVVTCLIMYDHSPPWHLRPFC